MKRREKKATRLLLEELEPRILHSADVAVLVPPVAFMQLAEVRLVDSVPDGMQGAAAYTPAAEARASAPRELAIVDSAVPEYQDLIDDIRANSGGRVDVFVLDAATDGLDQISQILASQHDIAAIHIISHGSDGAIQLGAGVLDQETLKQNAAAVAGWSAALTADADILLYGCDVAQDAAGRAFVDALAGVTGADVAASADRTGSSVLGGNWALEYNAGAIGTSAAPSIQAQARWAGTLGAPAVVALPGAALNYTENDAPAIIDATATVTDADSVTFDTGSLTVGFSANGTADDRLGIRNQGTGAGEIGVSGVDVSYGGMIIGSYVGGAGTTPLVLTFNAASSPAAAEALLRNITFENVSDAPSTLARTVSFVLVDETGDTGIAATQTVDVAAVNDAPTASNLSAAESCTEDTPLNLTDIVAGDVDSANVTATLTLSNVVAGSLNTGTSGAVTSTYSAATGVWSASGAVADVNTLLAGLTYTPAADFAGGFTIATSVSDGVAAPVTGTKTMTATAVNDAPVLAGTNDMAGINRNPTSNPGTLVADLLTGHVTDPDTGAVAGIAVTAVDNTNGAWQYSTDGGAVWTAFGAPGTATARLLAADVATFVRFVPNANYSGTVANGLSFHAWDQTTGAAGATADTTSSGGATAFSSAAASASIIVSAANTAPTLTGSNNLTTVNEDQAANAGTLVSALLAGFTSDADPGASTGIAVTAVDNTNGAWQYSLDSGAVWTSFGSPAVTSARLLAADAGTYVRFVPNADWNGTVNGGITFRAWDRSTGVAGATADTSGLAGTFRDNFQTVSYANNDGTLAWTGSWIENDSQGGGAASGRFEITSGILFIQAGNAGDNIYREANLSGATGATLSFTYGSGLKNNAVLQVQVSSDGGANYTTLPGGVFDASTNTFVGTRSFDITSSITSNTRIRWYVAAGEGAADSNSFYIGNIQITASARNGGSTAFSTATASSGVTVNPVNDAPVRTAGSVSNLTVLEDAVATSLGLGALAYAPGGGGDEAAQSLTYTVTALPSAALGAVTLVDGTTAVTANTGYTLGQLQGMRFKAAANASGGPSTFSWNVADSGGTTNGGVDALSQSLTVTVTSVNDTPSGTGKTVTTLEDTAYTFSAGDFGFTDASDSPANALSSVRITTVPGAGTLAVSGVTVTAGQFVSVANITGGNLRFTPAANANGAGYASFTFQVRDDGGVANGGVDTDPTARTMIVDVTAVNDAPAGANRTVSTLEDTAYTFSTADFGFTDSADAAPNALLNVKITALPGAGNLTLSGVAVVSGQFVSAAGIAAGDLKFNPAANANGAGYASFTFQVQDDGGAASGGVDTDPTARTMTVNVTSVNDAPSGASKTVTTLEDTAYTFGTADFGFTDPADPNALLDVKIATLPGAGSLTLSGAAVAGGQFVSAASIAAGNLKFNPAANANGAGYASFTFQVRDDGGITNSGVDTDPIARTMTVNVTSVNDAPAGASKTVTTLEDTAYTFGTADFGFTDTDANALLDVKIATAPGAGSLTLSGVAVVSGQFVSAASIAAGNLKFDPAANASGAGYASFTFQVQDDGGVAGGGVDTDATARTMTVNVTSVNDAPSGASKTVTTLEDTAYTFGTADFGFADLADPNALLDVKIATLPAAGSLTLSGVAVASGQFVSAASIAAGSLKFNPAANVNGAGYASFTFEVRDDGGVANGGVDTDPIARTMTVNVTSVNDAPAGANKTVMTLEDTAYTFGTADFGFTDADAAPNALLNVRIGALPATGSLTLSGVAVAGGQLVSAASITAGDLKFAPAANANGSANASFTFQVQDDGGAVGGGIDLDPTPKTMTVSVTAVNDAPAGSDRTLAIAEDTAYTFSAADFGFTDPADAVGAGGANALAAVRIATLPLAGTLANDFVAVTSGQLVSLADLNAGKLIFIPAANANGAGYTSFTFQVTDDGGVANGGMDVDPVARTMALDVTPVNDAPSSANNTVTTREDIPYVFNAADFGFTDPQEANALLNVRIATLPGAGNLTLSGAAVTNGQFVSAANIASGALVFTPAANANGAAYASFTFQVQDDGGVAGGGADTDPVARTMTMNVTALNDAPSGADKAVSTLEDAPYVFSAGDFGFADAADAPANALLDVRIGALSGAGSFTLAGVALTSGQLVSAADIAAGSLVFAPAANANGAAYASFTFQVQDDGGVANGGVDLDATARTMTVNVTPVNDAPAGADKIAGMLEDTVYIFSAADFGYTDPNDANALLNVKIATLPAAGTLTLAGIAVTSGQSVSAAAVAAGGLRFTPAPNQSGAAYASFTFQVQDDGGVANGGVDNDAVARTLTMNVTSVNDAPSGISNTVTTLEDAAYVFRTSDFGFADGADSNALLAVKISALPGAGSLTLAGVAVTSGQLVAAVDIASGAFQFNPAPDANGAAYASFVFQVQDDGGVANGGVDLDVTARTMTVNVTSVNDAPSGADATVVTLEDTAYTFGPTDFGFSDRDGNAFLAVRIGTLPSAGSLALAGAAVTAGQVVSAAAIAAGDLKLSPAADANGAAYASFAFQVQDDGGTANGGADTDVTARTLTLNVTSVNDAPAGADTTVKAREDTAYTFAVTDFGYTDPADNAPNALLNVKIGVLAGAGSFTLGGVAITSGQIIPIARITAGELQFTPARSGTGAGYATLTFQLQDGGGVANGGADSDGTPRTITVDVIRTKFPDPSVPGGPVIAAEQPAQAPTPAAAAEDPKTSEADGRAKSTLAKIAASLAEALAQTRVVAGNDIDAQVSVLSATPQTAADAASSRSAPSSVSARAVVNGAIAVAPDLLPETKPERAISMIAVTGVRANAAPGAAVVENAAEEADPKKQAYAMLTLENGVRASAIIVSAGMVSWTLQGAGLIASLLTSAPAWRHLDPMPVLAPEEEKPDWGENDGDAQREEDAADSMWRMDAKRRTVS